MYKAPSGSETKIVGKQERLPVTAGENRFDRAVQSHLKERRRVEGFCHPQLAGPDKCHPVWPAGFGYHATVTAIAADPDYPPSIEVHLGKSPRAIRQEHRRFRIFEVIRQDHD